MAAEIWVSGPIIEIALRGPDRAAAPIVLEAMIDTGASGICIDRRVALALGLIGSNRKPLQMADGSETVATSYRAFMSVKGLNCEDWVEVCGVPMKLPSSRVLLGRSFLRRYIVTYNGPEELFHDYDAEQRRNNSHFEHDE